MKRCKHQRGVLGEVYTVPMWFDVVDGKVSSEGELGITESNLPIMYYRCDMCKKRFIIHTQNRNLPKWQKDLIENFKIKDEE